MHSCIDSFRLNEMLVLPALLFVIGDDGSVTSSRTYNFIPNLPEGPSKLPPTRGRGLSLPRGLVGTAGLHPTDEELPADSLAATLRQCLTARHCRCGRACMLRRPWTNTRGIGHEPPDGLVHVYMHQSQLGEECMHSFLSARNEYHSCPMGMASILLVHGRRS